MASISKKITMLDIFAALTLMLIGIVGYLNITTQNRIIDGQKDTNISLDKINDTLNIYNARLENHDGRISRNTEDVKKSVGLSHSNRERISKLEGAR